MEDKMPIFQTVAAACRAAGEKLRSWKQKKRTDRLWRVVLWGILWATLCPTLGACGAQREELFLSEKESIAYGDGNRKVESKVEDTDQNREAEPNAGNTDQNREAESNAGDTDQNRKAEPSAGSTDRTELSDASLEEAKTLVVHICGAVSAPGVYELPAGSRIIDAVEAGGGFLPEADEACCNLAEEIVDGCQIYIMTKSESCADGQTEKKAGIQTSPDSDMQTTDRNVRSNSAPALENGLVNLNTADVAALMTLPGIGESRAKAIISYREQHGAFAKIEDIMKISGIKQAAFSKIKDKITV
ncbi:helix-hairpin-helix domain-containing protein [Gallintestinimicrobium propionicum]|uniref:helix-hairpin-helix domain-containing protein n=1 Tax=Gallintestinimicrobium propionicum TaxID=2981770 RepID=UPI0021D0BCB3|nr:helix-hairpin-helix domain-containing protein [Gallintestinimicrobium propionicum]